MLTRCKLDQSIFSLHFALILPPFQDITDLLDAPNASNAKSVSLQGFSLSLLILSALLFCSTKILQPALAIDPLFLFFETDSETSPCWLVIHFITVFYRSQTLITEGWPRLSNCNRKRWWNRITTWSEAGRGERKTWITSRTGRPIEVLKVEGEPNLHYI